MEEKRKFRVDLQVHLFKADYDLEDVLVAMDKRGLDAIGALSYKWDLRTTSGLTNRWGDFGDRYSIETGVGYKRFTRIDGRVFYFFQGEEVASKDQYRHFLSVGAVGITSSLKGSTREVEEETLAKGGLLIFDHPFADPQKHFKCLSCQKEWSLCADLRELWGRVALEWNAYCIPCVRRLLPGYGDVNKKAEKLARKMGLPLVPTTDLHARNRRLLGAMGTSYIEILREDMDFDDPFGSLKRNVLARNFTAQRKYVSFRHFAEAFGIPLLRKIRAGS